MRSLLLLVISVIIISCSPEKSKLTAQQIIDKSIVMSGLDKISNSELSFDFRNWSYKAIRKKNGLFYLERIIKKDTVVVRDILSNSGFQRFVNQIPFIVADSMANKYAESINSVHYFSVLPYGLNDAAVIKKMLPDVTIKGEEYYKIQITFKQEGGGVDFEDVFIYWIHKKRFTMDYLAYSFHVNGGGIRFREVTNEHIVDGTRFVNYNNYKSKDNNADLFKLDSLFEEGGLIKISEINLENIQFKPLLDVD